MNKRFAKVSALYTSVNFLFKILGVFYNTLIHFKILLWLPFPNEDRMYYFSIFKFIHSSAPICLLNLVSNPQYTKINTLILLDSSSFLEKALHCPWAIYNVPSP